MQSLISQITSLFASQSLNSIENSGLGAPLTQGQGFNSVFESFANGDNTANLAIFSGEVLPPASYTPISFQISQLTFASEPNQSADSINIQGELLSRDLTPTTPHSTPLHASTSLNAHSGNIYNAVNSQAQTSQNQVQDKVNNNILSAYADREGYNKNISALLSEKSNIDQETNNARSLDNQVLNNKLFGIEQTVGKYSINDRVQGESNQYSQTQSKVISDTNPVIQNSRFNAIVNNYDVSIDKVNNVIANQEIAQKNIDLNAPSKNTFQVINPSIKATQYGESYVTNKPTATDISGLSTIPSEQQSLVRGDVLTRVNANSANQEPQINQNIELKNQSTLTPNTQAVVNTKDVSQPSELSSSIENSQSRPLYNLNQYDEAKRNDTSYRGDRGQVNYTSSETSIVSDKSANLANQFNQNSNNSLDLDSSLNKVNELSPEIKSVVNSSVERPMANTLTTESLTSANNKVSVLDKSPFGVSGSNDVTNGEELAQQITWAKNTNSNHVKIALTPEHLGALEISIDQDRDGLNIQFTTQNASAKDAIETFMPRLKDMLEQQGLNLQNANVSQQDSSNYSDSYEQEAEQYGLDNHQDESQMMASSNEEVSNSSSDRLLEAFA